MSLGDYELFTTIKDPPRDTCHNIREEIIHAVGSSLLDINRSGRCLPQIWQEVVYMGGDYNEGM
jgi:hypothetical protein